MDLGLDSRQVKEFLPFLAVSRRTQPPIQWVPKALSLNVKQLPRLKICEAVHLLPLQPGGIVLNHRGDFTFSLTL
jgi:hypothetical protein